MKKEQSLPFAYSKIKFRQQQALKGLQMCILVRLIVVRKSKFSHDQILIHFLDIKLKRLLRYRLISVIDVGKDGFLMTWFII